MCIGVLGSGFFGGLPVALRHWRLEGSNGLVCTRNSPSHHHFLFLPGGSSLPDWNGTRKTSARRATGYSTHSGYTSMMTRSGGFAIMDPQTCGARHTSYSDMLIFVGGGSASTAGGIKVTTLAVLFGRVGRGPWLPDIQAFGRRIPRTFTRCRFGRDLGSTIVATRPLC